MNGERRARLVWRFAEKSDLLDLAILDTVLTQCSTTWHSNYCLSGPFVHSNLLYSLYKDEMKHNYCVLVYCKNVRITAFREGIMVLLL